MDLYSQRDRRWANIKLGTSDLTIGQAGCTVTCLAYLLDTTPDIINTKLIAGKGYSNGNLVNWPTLPGIFPEIKSVKRVTKYNNTEVKANIPCLVEVDGSPIGSPRHWVVFIGDGLLYDPWFGAIKDTGFYAPTGFCIITRGIITPEESPQDLITDDTILELPSPWNKISVRDVVSNLNSQSVSIEALTKAKEDQIIESNKNLEEAKLWKKKHEDVISKLATKLGTTQDIERIIPAITELIEKEKKLEDIVDDRPVVSASPVHKLLEELIALVKKLLVKNIKMNDLLKSDSLLAIVIMVVGLVSTVSEFWQKIALIVLAVAIVALRSFLKSQETWRK